MELANINMQGPHAPKSLPKVTGNTTKRITRVRVDSRLACVKEFTPSRRGNATKISDRAKVNPRALDRLPWVNY